MVKVLKKDNQTETFLSYFFCKRFNFLPRHAASKTIF